MSADGIDFPVDEIDETGQEIAVREAQSLVPRGTASQLVERLKVVREAMQDAMVQDVDYGVIPGTNKPALLKPGAEKLGALFQLDVQLVNEKIWHGDGHLTVVSRAEVFSQNTGARLGSGEGLCTTRETRYAYRNANRKCPSCGAEAIIKGRQEYGGGWVCFKKKGGCGAKYPDGDASIESQEAGKVPNPELADTYNTVTKMASKRARVDAVLSVTGASALFTQDVEDAVAPPGDSPVTRAPSAPSTPPKVERPAQSAIGQMRKDIADLLSKCDRLRGAEPGTTFGELDQHCIHDLETPYQDVADEAEVRRLGETIGRYHVYLDGNKDPQPFDSFAFAKF